MFWEICKIAENLPRSIKQSARNKEYPGVDKTFYWFWQACVTKVAFYVESAWLFVKLCDEKNKQIWVLVCCWGYFEDCEENNKHFLVEGDGVKEEVYFEWLRVCFFKLEVLEFGDVWDGG